MMDENEKKKAAAAASGEAVTDDLDTKKAAFSLSRVVGLLIFFVKL